MHLNFLVLCQLLKHEQEGFVGLVRGNVFVVPARWDDTYGTGAIVERFVQDSKEAQLNDILNMVRVEVLKQVTKLFTIFEIVDIELHGTIHVVLSSSQEAQ